MKVFPSAIALVLGGALLGAEWLGFWPSRICAASLLLEGLEFGTSWSADFTYNMAASDFGRTLSHVFSTSLPSAHGTKGSIHSSQCWISLGWQLGWAAGLVHHNRIRHNY